MLDWDAVRKRANGDGEFRLHARFWNSRLRLGIGAQRFKVAVDSGQIESIEPWFGAIAADIAINAPEQDWDALLAPVPKPFYQDLYPATLHHGFEVAGNAAQYCAYYPALRRLVEIMREVRNGAA